MCCNRRYGPGKPPPDKGYALKTGLDAAGLLLDIPAQALLGAKPGRLAQQRQREIFLLRI